MKAKFCKKFKKIFERRFIKEYIYMPRNPEQLQSTISLKIKRDPF